MSSGRTKSLIGETREALDISKPINTVQISLNMSKKEFNMKKFQKFDHPVNEADIV